MRKLVFANTKEADQPVHLRSLFSTFVVHCLPNVTHALTEI